jgi:hypothetical protein
MYYDKYFLNMVDDEDDEMFEEKHETKDSE